MISRVQTSIFRFRSGSALKSWHASEHFLRKRPGIYLEHSIEAPNTPSHIIQWKYLARFNNAGSVDEILAYGRDISKVIRLSPPTTPSESTEGEGLPTPSAETYSDSSSEKLTEVTDLAGLTSSIKNLPYPIFVVDPKGVVIAWNEAIAKTTGVSAEEVIGHGNHAYALPFYGEPRPMLVDYIIKPENRIDPNLPGIIQQNGDTFLSKAETINLRGKPKLIGCRATAVRDSRGTVIAAVQSILVSEHHLAGTFGNLYEEEQYLGGVSSVILKVTGKGLAGAISGALGTAPGGYGVYATDQRLFVAHNPELYPTGNEGEPGKSIVEELFGTDVDLGTRSIQELERMKIFEVWRQDIVSIEMKKPHLLAGFAIFQTRNGESFRIYIGHRKAFAHLEQLLMLSYPEILKDTTPSSEDPDFAWIDEVRTFDLIGDRQINNPLHIPEKPAENIPTGIDTVSDTRDPEKKDADKWSDLRLTLEQWEYPTFAVDKKGVLIAWNGAIEKLTGVEANAVLGRAGYEYAIRIFGEAKPMLIDYFVTSGDPSRPGTIPDVLRGGDTLTGNPEPVIIHGEPRLFLEKSTGIYDTERNLIAAAESILVGEQNATLGTDTTPERYIGGIVNITLHTGNSGTVKPRAGTSGSTPGGYDIYVTDRRLVIVRNPERDVSTPALPSPGKLVIKDFFGSGVDMLRRSIKELETRKVVEVPRKSVKTIEMKIPGSLPGYIRFNTKAGESFQISTDNRGAYSHLDQLLKMFYPEITRFE